MESRNGHTSPCAHTTTLALDAEAVETLFHELRRRLFARCRRLYGAGGDDLEGLVGEALLELARRHCSGKLKMPISNRYLDYAVREAFRIEARRRYRDRTVPIGSLESLGALAGQRSHPCAEMGDAGPPSLVRELRQCFHLEGGWTEAFERQLEQLLESRTRGEDPASLEERVLEWIAHNRHADVYHSEIADELGAARESVSRSIGRLRRRGQVIREPARDGARRSRYRLARPI